MAFARAGTWHAMLSEQESERSGPKSKTLSSQSVRSSKKRAAWLPRRQSMKSEVDESKANATVRRSSTIGAANRVGGVSELEAGPWSFELEALERRRASRQSAKPFELAAEERMRGTQDSRYSQRRSSEKPEQFRPLHSAEGLRQLHGRRGRPALSVDIPKDHQRPRACLAESELDRSAKYSPVESSPFVPIRASVQQAYARSVTPKEYQAVCGVLYTGGNGLSLEVGHYGPPADFWKKAGSRGLTRPKLATVKSTATLDKPLPPVPLEEEPPAESEELHPGPSRPVTVTYSDPGVIEELTEIHQSATAHPDDEDLYSVSPTSTQRKLEGLNSAPPAAAEEPDLPPAYESPPAESERQIDARVEPDRKEAGFDMASMTYDSSQLPAVPCRVERDEKVDHYSNIPEPPPMYHPAQRISRVQEGLEVVSSEHDGQTDARPTSSACIESGLEVVPTQEEEDIPPTPMAATLSGPFSSWEAPAFWIDDEPSPPTSNYAESTRSSIDAPGSCSTGRTSPDEAPPIPRKSDKRPFLIVSEYPVDAVPPPPPTVPRSQPVGLGIPHDEEERPFSFVRHAPEDIDAVKRTPQKFDSQAAGEASSIRPIRSTAEEVDIQSPQDIWPVVDALEELNTYAAEVTRSQRPIRPAAADVDLDFQSPQDIRPIINALEDLNDLAAGEEEETESSRRLSSEIKPAPLRVITPSPSKQSLVEQKALLNDLTAACIQSRILGSDDHTDNNNNKNNKASPVDNFLLRRGIHSEMLRQLPQAPPAILASSSTKAGTGIDAITALLASLQAAQQESATLETRRSSSDLKAEQLAEQLASIANALDEWRASLTRQTQPEPRTLPPWSVRGRDLGPAAGTSERREARGRQGDSKDWFKRDVRGGDEGVTATASYERLMGGDDLV